MSEEIVPVEVIENKIFMIRGLKVMLDRDFGAIVWSFDWEFKSTGSTKYRQIPGRFYVPIDKRGVRRFEMPIWHLKLEVTICDLKRRKKISSIRFYRTRNSNALLRPQWPARGGGQHTDHAHKH